MAKLHTYLAEIRPVHRITTWRLVKAISKQLAHRKAMNWAVNHYEGTENVRTVIIHEPI